ncbi:hypothetical protein SAMN02910353_02952 [Ruminococcus sp. YRD2003]|uniref:hypothetical protein n=1 Tax=Ruminococcus sp. YRD2003 TaxID=1452313 RepID=UPI0008B8F834|nr:hypothetical protein SAMN02910353_02952 [Ruminococcus flavefaciens]
MAWDNPHGSLSADERLRLEREAKILAEAQRKMLREEEQRAAKQREAEERRRADARDREERARRAEEERRYKNQLASERRAQSKARSESYKAWLRTPEGDAFLNQERYKSRAEKVWNAEYGSATYLRNRYGHAYYVIAEIIQNILGCTPDEAEETISQNYIEPRWKYFEQPEVEKLLREKLSKK